MMVTDEDALLCDLAETYGIFDIRSLPVVRVATFAIGLKGDSRIMVKMTGQKCSSEMVMLAGILDRLSFIAWSKTKDAQKGRNRPASVVDSLLNGNSQPEKDYEVFSSGEEFLEYLEKLRKG